MPDHILCHNCGCPVGIKGHTPACRVGDDIYIHTTCPPAVEVQLVRKAYGLDSVETHKIEKDGAD